MSDDSPGTPKIPGRLVRKPSQKLGRAPNFLKLIDQIDREFRAAPELREQYRELMATPEGRKQYREAYRWCCAAVQPIDGGDRVDIFAFGATSDDLCGFVTGDTIEVDVAAGRTRHRRWTGRDGSERTTAQHVAVAVRLLAVSGDGSVVAA